MKLSDAEQAMLDGSHGRATQKAMELLMRYAEALGAQRFVETTNVAGVPGSTTPFLQQHYRESGGSYAAIFSHFDLDSDEFDVPQAVTIPFTCRADDPQNWKPSVWKAGSVRAGAGQRRVPSRTAASRY